MNPRPIVVDAASPIFVDTPSSSPASASLVVEDGPTLTHGEMKYRRGRRGRQQVRRRELVDPRPYTVGTITETFKKYPDIGTLLPAMGYGPSSR